ncbi:MAG: FAD-dependent monooxygenase [Candidatus Dormiibacterota bacterium]
MKVSILGAGPAGLYLAILLRRASSEHQVTVVERNPPDATFGWGVVFSEETLGALREADPITHSEITDTFARWDRIDISYRGRRLNSPGHSFSAISRKRLLAILQRRCAELGATLRFGVEVTDLDQLRDGEDLLVGADGANSLVRISRADSFGSEVRPEGCKYVWFGTDLVLNAFTFSFQETRHGLVQAHAYPYDEHGSTWIVEAPEPTWRRLGLDEMNEAESLGFCQELFAEELEGHPLFSNRSTWLSFLRVRNRSWQDGNVVLLGDAAHTAHFSIGSGTKLAMEDAVSLARALEQHRSVAPALVDYELERQPQVDRLQQAAGESAAYFERVASHGDMAPIQFAFNLLTRSGRISHANLMLRDPDLVRVLDSWCARGERAQQARVAPPPAFSPLRLGDLELSNRLVGALGPDEPPECKAASGMGVVLTEMVAVAGDGRISPETRTLERETDARQWEPIVAAVHRGGGRIALQLGHAGRRGATRPHRQGVDLPLGHDGWPLLSASPLAYGPFAAVPTAMSGADLIRVRRAFAGAAALAASAGFDMLELNAAEGYLLASFLSPLTNRRDDDYGGSLENRLRFPLEVLDAIRETRAGPVVAVRLTISDWSRRGLQVDDGVEIARSMARHGAQLIHVSAGQTVAEDLAEYGRGSLTAIADRVRSEARVPVLVGGHLTSLDEVNTIVGAGRADLCLLSLAESALESVAADEARTSVRAIA